MNTQLTDYEREIMTQLCVSSAGNGHDFGCIEDLKSNMKQARGAISSLSKKRWIDVHGAVVTDSGRWTQFTITDEAKVELGIGQLV